MRWISIFFMLLFVGCQPSYSEKMDQITEKSCQVNVQLTKRMLTMYREGHDNLDVMVMLNNYDTNGNAEAYAGKVLAQVNSGYIQQNVHKAFKDNVIMTTVTEHCKQRLGFKIPKGKY